MLLYHIRQITDFKPLQPVWLSRFVLLQIWINAKIHLHFNSLTKNLIWTKVCLYTHTYCFNTYFVNRLFFSVKTCPPLKIPYYGLIVCKNPDLNLFFDYSPRNKSFLLNYSASLERSTEPMPIDTDCSFKCGHGFYLAGSNSRNCLPLSKWDGLQTSCKREIANENDTSLLFNCLCILFQKSFALHYRKFHLESMTQQIVLNRNQPTVLTAHWFVILVLNWKEVRLQNLAEENGMAFGHRKQRHHAV